MFEFEIFVHSLENPDDQTQMMLGDYQNKNQFMAAAKSFVEESTGETNPELRFEFDEDSAFNGTNLITENAIDEKVWEYLALEDDEAIEMTVSFATLYPDESGNVSQLHTLASERSVGKYDKITDFGYGYLEAKGFMDNLPEIIENNIDIDAISSGLMMTHKTLNNWYFDNAEEDGWRMKGA